MERGFIRAEVVGFDELVRWGSLQAAREAGRVRLEGRDYEVREGDVITFRFHT
jgi:ribosome-binding ATPase YchF (GTP1/OBG family)